MSQLADLAVDNWDRTSHPMTKDDFGVFEIHIPAQNGQPAIPHNSKIKVIYQCRTHCQGSYELTMSLDLT